MIKKLFLSGVLGLWAGLATLPASAQLFGGGDDEQWEKIRYELKKINANMTERLVPEVKNIRTNQANLFQEIGNLKSTLPQLQGAVEQNHSDLAQRIGDLERRIASLEVRVQKDMSHQVDAMRVEQKKMLDEQKAQMDGMVQAQAAEMNTLKASVNNILVQLRDSMAKDMDKFAKLNQDAFKGLSDTNTRNFKVLEDALNTQSQKLDSTVGVIKEAVGGALEVTSENKQLIMANGNAIKVGNENLTKGFTGLDANLRVLDAKNQKLAEILEKSLNKNVAIEQTLLDKMDAVSANLSQASVNIDQTKQAMLTLKEVVDQKLSELSKTQAALENQNSLAVKNVKLVNDNLLKADQKMERLADGLKTLLTQNSLSTAAINSLQERLIQLQTMNNQANDNYNRLIDTTKTLLTNSSQVNQTLQLSLEKIEASQSQGSLSNEKINKLIDILKNIAAEQAKFATILSNQGKLSKEIQNSKGELGRVIAVTRSEINQNIETAKSEILKGVSDAGAQLHKTVVSSHDDLKAAISATRATKRTAPAKSNTKG